MKYRSGFVSNSSSSSFIVLGCRVSQDFNSLNNMKLVLQKDNVDIDYNNEDKVYDKFYDKYFYEQESSNPVFGFNLFQGSDDGGLEKINLNLDIIPEMKKRLHDITGCDIKDIDIYGGTIYN